MNETRQRVAHYHITLEICVECSLVCRTRKASPQLSSTPIRLVGVGHVTVGLVTRRLRIRTRRVAQVEAAYLIVLLVVQVGHRLCIGAFEKPFAVDSKYVNVENVTTYRNAGVLSTRKPCFCLGKTSSSTK